MIKDYFKLALENFKHRKMRSWLTMIGIFIGITAVVAIISLGQGLQVAINDQFAKLGNDKLMITPGSNAFSGTSSVVLNTHDKKIIDSTQGVDSSLGLHYQNSKVEFKDQDAYVLTQGVAVNDNPDLANEMYGSYGVAEGRLLNKGDEFKAVLGNDYTKKDKIFKERVNLGDKIIINGHKISIVGFFNSFGNSGDDSTVYTTKKAYEQIFNIDVDEDYKMIFVKTSKGENPNLVAERVKRNLRNSRGLDEGDEDFTIQSTEELMNSFGNILMIVNIVIIGLAAISLLVGGIGIMNTMYTAVVERTKEIGIMKAIGAKNRDVLFIFLLESGLLGFVGGLVGVIIGLGISKAVELMGTYVIGTPYLMAWWSWGLIGGALLFSFLVGALSGLAPAYQASKQIPVDSLRYE